MRGFLSLWPVRLAKDIWEGYHRCAAAQSAAALSYFLILTLFPLLIWASFFIGRFHLSLGEALSVLGQLLPSQVLSLLEDYLRYAALSRSPALLGASQTPLHKSG